MLGLENISNDIALHHILNQLDSDLRAEYPSVQCRWFHVMPMIPSGPYPYLVKEISVFMPCVASHDTYVLILYAQQAADTPCISNRRGHIVHN